VEIVLLKNYEQEATMTTNGENRVHNTGFSKTLLRKIRPETFNKRWIFLCLLDFVTSENQAFPVMECFLCCFVKLGLLYKIVVSVGGVSGGGKCHLD
jgi:hypothetical protein